jgi:hypothetical protein
MGRGRGRWQGREILPRPRPTTEGVQWATAIVTAGPRQRNPQDAATGSDSRGTSCRSSSRSGRTGRRQDPSNPSFLEGSKTQLHYLDLACLNRFQPRFARFRSPKQLDNLDFPSGLKPRSVSPVIKRHGTPIRGRSTSARISSSIGGRPHRPPQVQRRATSRRCQAQQCRRRNHQRPPDRPRQAADSPQRATRDRRS